MALFLVAIALASTGAAQHPARTAPPAEVSCPRDKLTSFTGRVTAYSRTDARIELTVDTDWDTREKFTLPSPQKMLLNSAPFRPEDWKHVEASKGRLKKGMRATLWVCQDGDSVLDWQPPPENQ